MTTTPKEHLGQQMNARLDRLPDIVFAIAEDGTILECRGGDPSDLTLLRRQLIGKLISNCPVGTVGPQFEAAMKGDRKSVV